MDKYNIVFVKAQEVIYPMQSQNIAHRIFVSTQTWRIP